MRIRTAIGTSLLALSAIAVLQTVREVLREFGTTWTPTPISEKSFTFAGRSIVIVSPRIDRAIAGTALVAQDRVLLDGTAVGDTTTIRMAKWPLWSGLRSPHWIDVVKFVDQVSRDSSLWISRRLQRADTIAAAVEIITLDAAGAYRVRRHTLGQVRADFRISFATGLIAEDAPTAFPLSVAELAGFPLLLLFFPLGTAVIGVILVWPRR